MNDLATALNVLAEKVQVPVVILWQALIKQATSGGKIRTNDKEFSQRTAEMLQLIVSARECQFG